MRRTEQHFQRGDKKKAIGAPVQLPISEVNPLVTNFAEEFGLAKSRMLLAPLITQAEFKKLRIYLRALVEPRPHPPSERILSERYRQGTGYQGFNLQALALLPEVSADGRRLLGLAYHDDQGLAV